MDPIKARLNEINFLEFCTRILSIRNRMIDIKLFIGNLATYINFNVEDISRISEMIFAPQFQVNISEIYALLNNNYISITEVEKLYKKSNRTIYRYKEKGKNVILYPRLNAEDQEILDNFMTQYDKFFTKNYQNILSIKGDD